MKKVTIFIPVAPFEPFSIIERSVISLEQLNNDGLDLNVLYLVDSPGGPDQRIMLLDRENIPYIYRQDTRGRRGGAINDGLDSIRRPDGTLDADLIAFFDVDSRPDPDFLIRCIRALEKDRDAVIASGVRYIINGDSSLVTNIIAAEYSFFEDVYSLYERFDGFLQFNGLIGVIDARVFDGSQLDEDVYCEDLEFTQRIYVVGKKAILADTRVGEQAPTTIKSLYHQRIRWLAGALEGLTANIAQFSGASIPVNRKIAWFTSILLPFVAFMLTPFVFVYGPVLKIKGHDRVFLTTLGLMFHVWLITLCGVVAITNQIRKKKTPWKESARSDI